MDTSGAKTLPDLLRAKTRPHPDKALVVFEDAAVSVASLAYLAGAVMVPVNVFCSLDERRAHAA